MIHRRPLPFRELHSTDETIVWRDPGGSWACLRPFSITSELTLPEAVGNTDIYVCGVFVKVVFLTVIHRRPLPLRELHSTDETIVWRDPGESWACLWPVTNTSDFTLPESVTHACKVFVEQVTWSSSFLFPWINVGRGGGGGGGGVGVGGTHLFPITNGSHTSTWPTSELNNDRSSATIHEQGLRIKLKHYAWGYISCDWLKWQPDYVSFRNRK